MGGQCVWKNTRKSKKVQWFLLSKIRGRLLKYITLEKTSSRVNGHDSVGNKAAEQEISMRGKDVLYYSGVGRAEHLILGLWWKPSNYLILL